MTASPGSNNPRLMNDELRGQRLRRKRNLVRADWMQMRIVVLAEQFKNGDYDSWEHRCSTKETRAVVDFAFARTKSRSSNGQPTHSDLLDGAREFFNVARGTAGNPGDGDTQVYGVCVDKTVIGAYQKIRQYSQPATNALESGETILCKTA